MSKATADPFITPEWQALHREAALVSQIIGAGATALGRASYGDGLGEYYTAFFGLSIGVERLAKLILIADFAIDDGGGLPGQSIVKRFGHNLTALVAKADEVATKHGLSLKYARPTDLICGAVIECLASFADASKGRYANFEAIGNPSFDPSQEPVNKWWREVVEPILGKHYRGKKSEDAVEGRARTIAAAIGDISFVRHLSESGTMMSDVRTASERSGQSKLAQKYGRFYTLVIVRWLSDIFRELSDQAVSAGIDALFGHYEYFDTYRVEDEFLRDRKVWPLA